MFTYCQDERLRAFSNHFQPLNPQSWGTFGFGGHPQTPGKRALPLCTPQLLNSRTANVWQVESDLETDGNMKKGKPSATAEGNAALRATELLRPKDERVCEDQFARRFLGLRFGIIVRSRLLTRMALWYAERILPGAANSLMARTRYIDDYLKQRIDDGIEQLVILGAGYDSRPTVLMNSRQR